MSANSQVMEHRWGTRVPLGVPAELRAGNGPRIAAVVGNASLSGAYLVTRQRLPVLSRVSVRAEEGGTWLEGWIVRHDAEGMGVEWLDPGLRAICALLALRQDAPGLPATPPEGRVVPLLQRRPAPPPTLS